RLRPQRDPGPLEPLVGGVDVVDREGDVAGAGVARPLGERAPAAGGVLDQLEEAAVRQVEVRDRDARARDSRHVLGGDVDGPRLDVQAEQVPVERERAVEVGDGDADVVQPADHASRSGTMSRANTSSTFSGRLIHSAPAPETSTVPGRGRPLKFDAQASWYAPVSR